MTTRIDELITEIVPEGDESAPPASPKAPPSARPDRDAADWNLRITLRTRAEGFDD